MEAIKVGDVIRFRAATRWSDRAVDRTVVGIDPIGRPEVCFGGYRDFVVRNAEIISVNPA